MASELGGTGLNQYSGIIQDDFLREWRGIEAYKRANEMRLNSPVIGALLLAIEMGVVGVDWTLSSDQGKDDERLMIWQAFVENVEHGFAAHVREALTFLPFGFSLFEVVWDRRDGYILPVKLAPRGQDTVSSWKLADNGDIHGFVQQAAPLYRNVEIPAEKLVHYRNRVERNNPEGRSILRPAWVSYYYAKNIQQIEGIGVERDLAGLPMVKLPDGASTDTGDPGSDASKAAKIVRNIRRDEHEGIVLPSGWDLNLLSTGGTRQFDTDKIINRYESRMLMAALAQFLMLGQESIGSYALSSDQTDLFTTSVNAVGDIVSTTLRQQLLPRMMALNGYTARGLRLDHSPAGDVNLSSLADMLQKVAGFLTWTTQDELWLRRLMNMPEPSAEEIEGERELAREERVAMARNQSGTEKPSEDPDATNEEEEEIEPEEEDLGADFFASRPDGAKRMAFERRFRQAWAGALSRMKGRVVAEAKELRNGVR